MSVKNAWFTLTVAFITLFFSSGLRFTFGIILKPMSEEMGWGRAETTMAATVFFIVSALVMPIYGRLIDRYNLIHLMIVSIAVTSLGFALVMFVQAPWQFIFFYGIIFAVGHSGFSILAISILVGRAFPDRAGIANGVAMSGFGFGQLIIIGLLTLFVSEVGWRISHLYLAGITVLVLTPLLVFQGRIVDLNPRKSQNDDDSINKFSPISQFGLVRFIVSPKFIGLTIIYAVCGFQDFFISTHIASFATDNGLEEQIAGNLLAIMGLFALGGVLIGGFLGDRFKAGLPTFVCFSIRLTIFILICTSTRSSFIVLLALLYGFTFLITAPLTVVFVKDIFGTYRMGTLIGIINMVHQFSGAFGAFLGGVIFDQTGSYQLMMIAMIPMSLVTVLCTYFMHGTDTFKKRVLN